MSDYSEHLISLAGGDGEPALDLNEIQARADAATEGPWYVDGEEQTVRAQEYAGEIIYDRSPEHPTEWAGFKPTAEFIAHARTDVPALISAIRVQAAKLDAILALANAHGRQGFLVTPADIRSTLEAA